MGGPGGPRVGCPGVGEPRCRFGVGLPNDMQTLTVLKHGCDQAAQRNVISIIDAVLLFSSKLTCKVTEAK